MFSVMWSERCSNKSSRPLLATLPTGGPDVVAGPGENAGVQRIGDGLAVAFAIASHHHTSAVEPYQGAAAGVGGVLRAIVATGARPIAVLDALRFGDPHDARTRHLVSGVVGGIGGYASCVGVPTVGGELVFDLSYQGHPLVNVMAIGIVREDRIVGAAAPGPGNLVVLYGSTTGRDGIGSASMLASTTFGDQDPSTRPAVQLGDPVAERRLIEATLEIIDLDLVEGIQALDSAGITCGVAETADRAGTGIVVDLDAIPRGEPGIAPFEVMISESQEAMVAIVAPDHVETVAGVCARWGLPCAVIGRVTADGDIAVVEGRLDAAGRPGPGAREIARVPARALASEAIVLDRLAAPPARRRPAPAPGLPPGPSELLPERGMDPGAVLLGLFGSPNLSSRRWVHEQYDHQVGTSTVTGPGRGAAVLRVEGTRRAIVATLGCDQAVAALDPYLGAALSVAQATRNVSVTGARPVGVTHCLSFGDPTRPEAFWQLKEAVRGLGDACRALGVPVTGGHVSLSNEAPGSAIAPTPMIGAVGLAEAVEILVGPAFAGDGEIVLVAGATGPGLGGSAYAALAGGGDDDPPTLDLRREVALQALLRDAIAAGLVTAAHGVSRGGLAVALAEMATWGGRGGRFRLAVAGSRPSPSRGEPLPGGPVRRAGRRRRAPRPRGDARGPARGARRDRRRPAGDRPRGRGRDRRGRGAGRAGGRCRGRRSRRPPARVGARASPGAGCGGRLMGGRIAVGVSGGASNLRALAARINRGALDAEIALVFADRPCAALDWATEAGLDTALIEGLGARSLDTRALGDWNLTETLKALGVDAVVLAGFAHPVGPILLFEFAGRVLNVHPSLLPAFPGRHAVRDALAAGATVTGVTVQLVDERLDKSAIVLAEAAAVLADDTEETLLERLHAVEHRLLPRAVGLLLAGALRVEGRRVTVDPAVAAAATPTPRRALLSVSDKTGLASFAAALVARGFELVSTGGTARALREAGLPVTDVAAVTGFPEMLDGRVKTLHPRVHGGILADRRLADHREQLAAAGIEPFELVVVNLYPFAAAAERALRGELDLDGLVEEIDIGGPSMVRAAAKNHASVAIVTDPGPLRRHPRGPGRGGVGWSRPAGGPRRRRVPAHRGVRRPDRGGPAAAHGRRGRGAPGRARPARCRRPVPGPPHRDPRARGDAALRREPSSAGGPLPAPGRHDRRRPLRDAAPRRCRARPCRTTTSSMARRRPRSGASCAGPPASSSSTRTRAAPPSAPRSRPPGMTPWPPTRFRRSAGWSRSPGRSMVRSPSAWRASSSRSSSPPRSIPPLSRSWPRSRTCASSWTRPSTPTPRPARAPGLHHPTRPARCARPAERCSSRRRTRPPTIRPAGRLPRGAHRPTQSARDLDLAWRLVRGVTSNAIVLVRDGCSSGSARARRAASTPPARPWPRRRRCSARSGWSARRAPRTRSTRSRTRSRSASRRA